MKQMDLFSAVNEVYLQAQGPVSQDELYESIKEKLNISTALFEHKKPIGKDKISVNVFKRKVRWYQQTLKQAGVIGVCHAICPIH